MSSPKRSLLIAVAALWVLGSVLVSGSEGLAATSWMIIFRPSDFVTLEDLTRYLRELRTGIPPVLSALEILSHQLTGTTAPVTVWLYRLALLGGYTAAIVLAARGPLWMWASFGLSLVFLWGTVLIHPGNAQVYDVLFPFFVLLFVLLLRTGAGARGEERLLLAASAGAGFFLSMAELTRPFVVLVLPVVLVFAWAALGERRRRIAFLMPLLLLSGGWHLHLALAHGQLSWSNQSGFNLHRTWRPVFPDEPELVDEPDAPLVEGRWKNLNTAAHTENDRRHRDLVLRQMLRHPLRSARYYGHRCLSLLSAPTDIYNDHPRHPVLPLYRVAAAAAGLWFLIQGMRLAWALLWRRGRRRELLAAPQHALLVIGLATFFFSSLGGIKEEARFTIQLLPLYAALPVCSRYAVRQGSRP